MVCAAFAHAPASIGRRPRECPWHLETQRQRQHIYSQCHYHLRGATEDDYAKLEKGNGEGKHAELYLGPAVREAFLSCHEGCYDACASITA
eukprot:3641232-Pyramimonas_sp.AAC.1